MNNGMRAYWFPYMASFIGHVLLFAVVIYSPDLSPKKDFLPSVIDVSMVTLKAASSAEKGAAEPLEKKAEAKPPEKKVETSVPTAPPEPKPEPEVSTAKPKPKPVKQKTSLKRKTFKPNQVVKRAIKKIEKDVAKSSADTRTKALERLRKQVKQDEASRASAPATGSAAAQSQGGGQKGATGRRRAELIEIYQVEIAHRIQANWAFAEQLAGDSDDLMASIVIKVLPDGQITDITFFNRSGNTYFDEAAYKAIVKTNPVDPHPRGVIEPFVMLGLNFSPSGVR